MEWKTVFHQRINELWERAKDRDYRLTQEDYARRLGTSRSGLRGWLAGKGQPDADGFVRVAIAENVSLEWLLGDHRSIDGYTPEERSLVKKYRRLSAIHREDIQAFVDRYYAQDHPATAKPQVEKRATS